MKNKSGLVVLAIIIVGVIIIFMSDMYTNKQESGKDEEYINAIEKYDKTVNIANKVNDIIHDEYEKAMEFLRVNPNSSKADLLRSKANELIRCQINIYNKTDEDTAKSINSKIEKMEEKIKEIDEQLLSSSTEEIKISEDSKVATIIKEIDEMIQAGETTQEQQTMPQEKVEEPKQQTDPLANLLNGDFTYFAGTYTELSGTGEKLTLDSNGRVTVNGRVLTNKPLSIEKKNDGSYWCLASHEEISDNGFYIFPVGIPTYSGNTNKVRIVVAEDMGALEYQKD